MPRLVGLHVVCTRPHRRCTVGYLSSYVLFALGRVLFGLSSLRARLLPGALSIAIVVGGLVGFKAASPPFGLALGVALTWLGAWMIKAMRIHPEPSRATETALP